MDDDFKPMLSAAVTDPAALRLPLLASVKLDGVRAVVRGGVVLSRKLKPIPNMYVQSLFSGFEGLDGELLVGAAGHPDVFRRTTSGVMSVEGTPNVYFHVFDCLRDPYAPYVSRAIEAARAARLHPLVKAVPQVSVGSQMELEEFEAQALGRGCEGVMLRSAEAPYKYGRGTLKAQDLLKLKRFADAEARVVGFEEQMHNTNVATRDALGHTERSSKKAGLVGKGTLGALTVKGVNGPYRGVTFNVGAGFDDALRAEVWRDRAAWTGRVIKYKYFPTGSKDAPRFPVFLGERAKGDL